MRKKVINKKLVCIGIGEIIVIVLCLMVVWLNANEDKVYTDGNALVTVKRDGTFIADLYHNERYKGTYTETEDGNVLILNYNGLSVRAEIVWDALYLPREWGDGHGHGQGVLKLWKQF